MIDDSLLRRLMNAIASADGPAALDLLTASPALATASLKQGATRAAATDNFLTEISHYVYAGDTALHVAAAAHQPEIARALIDLGADVAARNQRGATPLHYAADGSPGSPRWNPARPLTNRPRTPSVQELSDNPRSRSAKLRAGIKLAA